jgi:hypothetical protein
VFLEKRQFFSPKIGENSEYGIDPRTEPVEHPEHGVTADSQEGGPHALDVLGVDASVAHQHLSLSDDLKWKLLFRITYVGKHTLLYCIRFQAMPLLSFFYKEMHLTLLTIKFVTNFKINYFNFICILFIFLCTYIFASYFAQKY